MRHRFETLLLPAALLALTACGEDVPPLAINDFSVSSQMVQAGQTVEVSWEVTSATSITITQDPPGAELVKDGTMATGTINSQPIDETTTIKLVATDKDGMTATKSVNISASGLRIATFAADPATIAKGTSTTLSWVISGGSPSEVVITDSEGADIYRGTDATGTSEKLSPDKDETYKISATPADGTSAAITAMTTVTVTSNPPTIQKFEARNQMNMPITDLAVGTNAQIFWEVDFGDVDPEKAEIQISEDGKVIRPWNKRGAARGSIQRPVNNATQVYLLEARNGTEDADKTSTMITLNGQAVPIIDNFTVTPAEYTQGSTLATATWSVSETTRTFLSIDGQAVPGFPGGNSGTMQFMVTGRARVSLIARNSVADTTEVRIVELGYNEPEPNDTAGQAIPIAGDGNGVRGTISAGDVDVYAVMVPEGSSIFAQAGINPATGACNFDTDIELWDATGTSLGNASSVSVPAPNPCAELFPAMDGFAANLPAGVYYIAVRGGNGGMATGQYQLIVRVIPPIQSQPNVQITPVGAPVWEIADVQQFVGAIGQPGMMFPDLPVTINSVLAPRHTVMAFSGLSAVVRPGAAHNVNYRTEFGLALAGRGYESKSTFERTEWDAPNGIFVGFTAVPKTGTSTGASADNANGLIIPNGLFPLTQTLVIQRNGDTWAELMPDTFTGDPSPNVQGLSHQHFLTIVSGAVAPMGAMPPPADFNWVFNVVDQTNNGYRITVPFRVN